MRKQDFDMSGVKAVGLDLDGTTLNKEHKLDDKTLEVFELLLAKGVHVILSTGRPFKDAVGLKQVLKHKTPLVTSNGAMLNDAQGIEDRVQFVSRDVVEQVLNREYPSNIIVNVYTRHRWFLNKEDKEVAEFFNSKHFYYETLDMEKLNYDRVVKIFLIDKDCPPKPEFKSDYLNDLEVKLKAEFAGRAEIVFSQVNCLEFNAVGVSKENTLRYFLNHHGLVNEEHLIAFGDGMNDLNMLGKAKYGFVMQNADQRLKDALKDYKNVIEVGYYYDQMVARVLNQLFDLGVEGLDPWFEN